MKPFLLSAALTLLISCTGTQTVSMWVDLDGDIPEVVQLQSALTACDFDQRAQTVAMYRDGMHQAFTRGASQLYSSFSDSADQIATGALDCMRDQGFRVVNAPQSAVEEALSNPTRT